MDTTASHTSRDYILIAIPAIVFFVLLFRTVSGVPFLDDYGSVLDYMVKYKALHGFGQHFIQVFATQHNEYRTIVCNALVTAQVAILGHCNLKALCILGDLLVIPLPFALYLVWKQGQDTPVLAYFVPASWLMFQLQYASCLNFAMSSFQNLFVVPLTVFTVYLASVPKTRHFVGSIFMLALTISTSGSGLFLIPVVLVMLLQQKRLRELGISLAASIVICLAYFHKYNFHSSQTHADGNMLSSVKHLSPAFALTFIGNLAAVRNPVPAIIFGLILVALFLWATKDRIYRARPALYYTLLFYFATAVAVSGLRSDAGLTTALGSRYRISCTVVVILMYFYLVEKYSAAKLSRAVRLTCATAFCLCVFLFTCVSDYGGGKFLRTKREKLDDAMLRWERHEPPRERRFVESDLTSKSDLSGQFEVMEPYMTDAVRAGVYTPPLLSEGHAK